MNCWAVIPVKTREKSKSRLAGVLGTAERLALVDAMLQHVLEAALDAREISQVCIVGQPRPRLPETIRLLTDPGGGLNPAVQSALASLVGNGPQRVIFVAADLPEVTAQELDLLAAIPGNAIAIAPDRHGTGTNALSLPLPAAQDFSFAFGSGSFARHCKEAQRLGLRVETIHSQGLEKDVDEPADLPDACRVLKKAP